MHTFWNKPRTGYGVAECIRCLLALNSDRGRSRFQTDATDDLLNGLADGRAGRSIVGPWSRSRAGAHNERARAYGERQPWAHPSMSRLAGHGQRLNGAIDFSGRRGESASVD